MMRPGSKGVKVVMSEQLWLAAVLLTFALTACAPSSVDFDAVDSSAVRVDAPTGQAETDRENIQAALDRVQPGGTVQFAAGTYRLGEGVRLVIPDVTVQGHTDGTVLRGCDPELLEFQAPPNELNPGAIIQNCGGLYAMADRQTIRNLTIEYAFHGIWVGTPPWFPPGDDDAPITSQGGNTIENNIFRYTNTGVRVVGPAEQATVIRDNEAINTYHAFQANGAAVHFLNNRISVPQPDDVPMSHHPESGFVINRWEDEGHTCEGSRVVGNVIEGTVNGIQVLANPGQTCSGHEIRDNEIRLGEVPLADDYPDYLRDFFFGLDARGTAVTGTAIRLHGVSSSSEDQADGRVIEVLIENNRVIGGAGLGIQLFHGSMNQLIGNEISGIRKREPFPGLTWGEDATVWEEANGSGIWISPGSENNYLEGNRFDNIEAFNVIDDGEGNEVIPGGNIGDIPN
tara:strand:+ start:1450 stop:2817 length:1368 start_codon:yes stop_codon:yes gene_type:complete